MEYRVIQAVSYFRICMTKRSLESLNVSIIVIDIGFCCAVTQSLDTDRADLLPYSPYSVMEWHAGHVESVTELSD